MTVLKSIAAGLYLAVASIALSAGSAQATLLSIPDSQMDFLGSGAVTFDDVNKLEWLDLTFSTNRTFASTALEFGAGGDFEGWRHATALEVIALFTEGGFPPNNGGSPATQEMVNFIELVGRTITAGAPDPTFPTGDDFVHAANGYYGPSLGASLSARRVSAIMLDDETYVVAVGVPDNPDDQVGNWLVRAPIPEPTALILFGSGVVLLGAMRRRKRGTDV